MCNKPCRECPWKRSSIAGWLGASDPLDFIETERSDVHMPCHMAVDYERKDWRDQVDSAPACAGRRIFIANQCRMPRVSSLTPLPSDHEMVFSNAMQFVEHHSHGNLSVTLVGPAAIPFTLEKSS